MTTERDLSPPRPPVCVKGDLWRKARGGWDNRPVSADPPYLAGSLLVASIEIEDGPFHRSVVLLLHHDEGGAQGVVLNQPLDADIDAVLPGWKSVATRPQTMFQGGPVELNSALGLVTVPGDDSEPMGVKHLFGGLGLVDLDAPPGLVAPEVAGMRIFAGYAGWSAGQLEHEIARGDWYVVVGEARDAFSEGPERLWSEVLARQTGNLKLVASYPDDPALN